MQKRRILMGLGLVSALLLAPITIPIIFLALGVRTPSRPPMPRPRRVPEQQRRCSMHSLRHEDPQLQSPLFSKLPAEIRRQIFLHIVQIEDPLVIASTCKCRSKKGIPRDRSRTCQKDKCTMFLSRERRRRPGSSDAFRPVRLLQTCARAYSEVLPLLYGGNTFEARDQNAVVLISRIAAGSRIHRLQYNAGELSRFYVPGQGELSPEWNELCMALAHLTELRWLRIELPYFLGYYAFPGNWSKRTEAAMWQPLKSVLPPGAHGKLVIDHARGHSPGGRAEAFLDGSGWQVKRPGQ